MSLEQGLGREVRELMANPSAEKRQEITDKISNYFSNDIFNDREKKIAVDVIRLLTHDSEIKVRKTLANNLKFTKNVPHDIIHTLANDHEEVAVPVLEYSSVLTQENLIKIVQGSNKLSKMIAVARRNDVSEELSEALVDKNNEKVVETLVSNKEAEISDETISKTLDRFARSGVIMEAVVDRGDLSFVIVEKIMALVSDDLKQKLVSKYKIKDSVAEKAIDDSHEENVLDFLLSHDDDGKKVELVKHLHETGKLTHSIILRALCKGDLLFFAYGLSFLSGMDIATTKQIVFKESVSSFSALYKKASMPKGTFDAVNIILRFALKETDGDGNIKNSHNFSKRMIERIIEGGYDTKVNMMKYFMVLMKSKVDSFNDAANS